MMESGVRRVLVFLLNVFGIVGEFGRRNFVQLAIDRMRGLTLFV
jgi:hypothetical protein